MDGYADRAGPSAGTLDALELNAWYMPGDADVSGAAIEDRYLALLAQAGELAQEERIADSIDTLAHVLGRDAATASG